MNKWNIIKEVQDNNEAVLKDENLNHLEIEIYNWHLTKFSLFDKSAMKTTDRKQ